MSKDDAYIDFPGLIDHAMRDVVRKALEIAERQSLPGDHHFFISFRTDFPSVQVSDTLKSRHPKEMTIVLQHQFWNLKVNDDSFSVTLSFNGVPENLFVPFEAMTAFADPSVKFGLQFHTLIDDDLLEEMISAEEDLLDRLDGKDQALSASKAKKAAPKKEAEPKVGGDDVVVTLDAFRKKQKKPKSDQ